ncbi:MAG: hypothetical protein H0U98_00235 [Alphaproteobacteria bacterium]|nr:hypothetical protein [Alphaproteobacteria bacterium]
MIRLTAEGMIRNFGDRAADEADAVARRHTMPTTEGQTLWQAIAQEIRSVTLEPSINRSASSPP